MDARRYLLQSIYAILRPLNLWDEYDKPGWSDRQFVRDCLLRVKRGDYAAWSDFLVRLESDRPLAIEVLRLLIDELILIPTAEEQQVEADMITAIKRFRDEFERGPDVCELKFNLPAEVSPFSDAEETRLRSLLDRDWRPKQMLLAETLAGAKPNDASLYRFANQARFLPPRSKSAGEIMYIERKRVGASKGRARIGRVHYSKTRKTLYYDGTKLQSLKGGGGKANYYDVEFGTWYWISKCRKDGTDTLYPGEIEIDDDVREEYWTEIRQLSENKNKTSFRSPGKYSKRRPG